MFSAAKEENAIALPFIGRELLPLAADAALLQDADPALLENHIGKKSSVAKNSRQGFATKNHSLHQGFMLCNSTTALGMRGTLFGNGIRSRCTGKERDGESGLDYFGARYYGSSMGRWMSPDWSASPEAVPYADLSDPQTLNLYGYVRNNPLSHADADGHCCDLDDVLNFAGGAMNAFGSDNLFGAGRVQQNTAAGKIGAAVGDAVATVQGTVEALGGAGVEGGGLVLDATGVGAVVGVPANVVGAGMMVHGGSTALIGGANLLKSANDSSGSTLQPGPSAGESVPARGPQRDFTPAERDAVNKAGQESGCHTCGSKNAGTKSGNFIPDHQPPTKANPNNQPQRLYPQCQNCSRKQGGDVNAAKTKKPEKE